MGVYINSLSRGLFIGHFMGVGFFISHILEGRLPLHCARPVKFDSVEIALGFLNEWPEGGEDCEIKSLADEKVEQLIAGINRLSMWPMKEGQA